MSYKLLFADDDAIWWNDILFKDALQSTSFNVDLVVTPEEGLGAATQRAFDVVLLDICFASGEPDGLSVLPKIKAAKPELKVVMFSSMDDVRTKALCKSLGATTFVSKNTVTADGLKQLLDKILAK